MSDSAESSNSTVFRVMLTMNIKPGMEEEFEQTWHRVGSGIVRHPANLGHWLSRSAEEPSTYFIVSDWVDEANFREFEHSDAHIDHRQQLHPYRSGGSMSTARVVYGMAGAAQAVA